MEKRITHIIQKIEKTNCCQLLLNRSQKWFIQKGSNDWLFYTQETSTTNLTRKKEYKVINIPEEGNRNIENLINQSQLKLCQFQTIPYLANE